MVRPSCSRPGLATLCLVALAVCLPRLFAQTGPQSVTRPLDARIAALDESVLEYLFRDQKQATRLLDQATALIEAGGASPATKAYHLRVQGNVKTRLAEFDAAQKCFTESIRIFEQLKDSAGIALVSNDIGLIYMETKQFNNAERYFRAAVQYQRRVHNYPAAANTLANMAGIYFYNGQREKILPTLAEALVVAKAAKDTSLMITIYTNRIQTFFKFGETGSSAEDIRELENIAALAKDVNGMAQVLYYKGYVEKVNGNYAVANQYYTQSLGYFRELKNVYRQRDLNNAIAANAALTNDYKTAYESQQEAARMTDSVFSLRQEKTINELSVKYETEKKEAQLKQQMIELELANLRGREAANEADRRGLLLKTREQELAAADLLNQQARLEAERDAARIARQKAELATARQRQAGLLTGILVVALLLGLLARQFWLTRRTNRALASSNKRIELMLRELHHRVKNNLQIVSSLFRLQARRATDSATASVLREGQARVDAMSILHQQLYQNEAVTDINLQVYLETLLEKLRFAYGFEDRPFSWAISVQPETTDVDKALPIGLIMNELLTNSFKYAFADTPDPRIEIRIDPHQIRYSDNGKGLPETFDPRQATSFGMRLIGSFSQQLQGEYSFRNENGLTFSLNM